MSEDYDEIDVLIDTDPIALGDRCRDAEARYSRLVEAVRQLLDPLGGQGMWDQAAEYEAAEATVRALLAEAPFDDSDFFGTRPVVDVKDERL